MVDFKLDEVVVLLGAGASVEAGIPHATDMIRRIEGNISRQQEGWSEYKALYNYVRSAIFFAEGIHGRTSIDVNYNIEKLVNTLNEINKRNEHTLFPFVGAWSPALIEVAGNEFALVEKFRDEIVNILIGDWLAVKNYDKDAQYFEGLLSLQKSLKHPLRVFTLNYDLCLEKCARQHDRLIELGFDNNRKWDWRLFDNNPQDPKDIYLYKLHGSMNWTYHKDELTFHDDISTIEKNAIIFGTYQKLEYREPFLFLTYEFRRWTLESRLIIVIGYGFGDEHINTILRQALASKQSRVLLSVGPLSEGRVIDDCRNEVASAIGLESSSQIKISPLKASEFFREYSDKDTLNEFMPDEGISLFDDVTKA